MNLCGLDIFYIENLLLHISDRAKLYLLPKFYFCILPTVQIIPPQNAIHGENNAIYAKRIAKRNLTCIIKPSAERNGKEENCENTTQR